MQRTLLATTALALLGASALAQDLTVSRIAQHPSGSPDFRYYGTSNGINAYSFSTTSCNVGTIPIDWYANGSNRHPVIGQNMFRIDQGRIEQLGQSWLKHGFCAVNETSCGDCQDTPCTTLGVGCADTYASFLNDGQMGGAKSNIDPTLGYHAHPYDGPTGSDSTLLGRLQVPAAQLGIPGAIYVAEGQYVSNHDQLAGNVRNNASWRRIDTSDPTNVVPVGGTSIGDPAIYAWAELDLDVTVIEVVNEDEGGPGVHGWYFLAWKARELGGGLWRYEYALQNLSSRRGAGSFAVPAACAGLTISDVTFHDVDYHSGEIWDNTDWRVVQRDGWLRFESTTTWSENPNGNALRWGTLYNFGFTANAAPVEAGVEIGLYEPGTPAALTPIAAGPCHALACGFETYCHTAPNSYGGGARIWAYGSASVSANDLTLVTTAAVPHEIGIYYYGTAKAEVPFGDGFRCVGGQTWRIHPPIQANLLGDVTLHVDYARPPFASGPGAIDPGDTFHWQLWYRDPMGSGGSGFNLSDALRITFCP